MQTGRGRWAWYGLLALNVILIFVLTHHPQGRFHIWIRRHGEGFLVLAPSGRSLLVDGGSDAQALSTWVGNHLPPFIGRLDTAVLLSTDEDVVAAQVAVFQHEPPREGLRLSWTNNPTALAAWERGTSEVHVLDVGNLYRWEGFIIHTLTTTPPVLAFYVGTFRWLYMPQGCARNVHADVQMWILGSWARCAEHAFPQWIVGDKTEDEAIARALLTSPATRVFLGQGVHIVTDGLHYRWEGE